MCKTNLAIPEHGLQSHLMKTVTTNGPLRLFALIDGTAGSEIQEFFVSAPTANYFPLFLGTEYAHCLPASPYLAEVDPASNEYLKGRGNRTLSDAVWFTSTNKLEDQVAHWQSLLHVLLPDDREVLFRFWSGRILQNYLPALNPEALRSFLAPAEHLWAPNVAKRTWEEHVITDGSLRQRQQLKFAESKMTPWWVLDARHLNRFETNFTSIHVQSIENELWINDPELMAGIHPAVTRHKISQGLEMASALGLTTDLATVQFIALQLRIGPDFWQHSPWKACWQDSSNPDDQLLHLTQTIVR